MKKIQISILSILFIVPFTSYALNVSSYSFNYQNADTLYINDLAQKGLDLSNELTFEAWIKLDSFEMNPFQHIVAKRVGIGDQRSYDFYLYFNVGNPVMVLETQLDGFVPGCAVTVPWAPELYTWHHVAVSKSGTSVQFYVDGKPQGDVQACFGAHIYDGSAPFEIGGLSYESWYFDGNIDEVRVWNIARTEAEIFKRYHRELPSSERNGLVGYWMLNGVYTDASGNENTLASNSLNNFSTDVPHISCLKDRGRNPACEF